MKSIILKAASDIIENSDNSKESIESKYDDEDIPKTIDGTPIVDLDGEPPIFRNGQVTLFHFTSEENKKEILKTGKWKSRMSNQDVYFATDKNSDNSGSKHYGDAVVTVKIDPRFISIHDVFHGDISVTVPIDKLEKYGHIQK